MRFGFNDQTGHLSRHGLVAPWVNCLRVPVPVTSTMDVIDQYMYVAGQADTMIFCLYDTNQHPDSRYFVNLAVAIRRRHPSALIEVFNEPNLDLHGAPSPEAVRSVTENVVYMLGGQNVIGPAMAPVGDWQSYFRTVYAHRNFQPALHLYPHATDWAAQVDRQIGLCWEYTNGGPWHVTEMGMGREFYPGEANQASKTVSLVKKVAAKGAATGVVHSLTKLVQTAGDWEDRMKLWAVRPDGSLSALGVALKSWRT
jgi:hypothetical protein